MVILIYVWSKIEIIMDNSEDWQGNLKDGKAGVWQSEKTPWKKSGDFGSKHDLTLSARGQSLYVRIWRL